MSVYGRTEYTFYRLPYNAEAKIQPLFKDNERREAFFEDKKIERIEILSTSTSTATLSPKQTSFKLVTGVGKEYIKIPVASRVAWALREYRRINYMRVRRFFSSTTGIPSTSSSFDELCFWVTGVDIMPVVQKRPEGVTQNAELAFMLSITLDAWGTYVHPYNGTTTGAYGLRETTIVEQSTPSPFFAGGDVSILGEYPLKEDDNGLARREYSLKIGSSLDFGDAFFVGVFSTSKSDWSQVVCTCPLKFRDEESTDVDEDFLRKLLKTQRLVKTPVRARDFANLPASILDDADNPYIMERYNASPESLGNVQLVRAFIVPRGLLQEYESSFVLRDDVTPDTGILGTSVYAGVVPDVEVNDILDGGKSGLALLATDKVANFDLWIPYTATEIDDITEDDVLAPPPVFMDFGTETKRIELPQPRGGDSGLCVFVRVTSNANKTGLNTLITCGAQTIDVGGDFEIAVPYNEGQAEAQRNKWSHALQGVTSVGGAIAGIATGNVLVATMGAVNSATHFARMSEAKNKPATIQGQGNGEYLLATPRPMLYVRFFYPSPEEERVASRWGYKWLFATPSDVYTDGDELLLYPALTDTQARIYVKTAGASLYPSQYFETPSPQIPADARMAIEEDLDAGVTLVVNPPTTDEDVFRV